MLSRDNSVLLNLTKSAGDWSWGKRGAKRGQREEIGRGLVVSVGGVVMAF